MPSTPQHAALSLFHGSSRAGLTHLRPNPAARGPGIYLTSSVERAIGYAGQRGSVYWVHLQPPSVGYIDQDRPLSSHTRAVHDHLLEAYTTQVNVIRQGARANAEPTQSGALAALAARLKRFGAAPQPQLPEFDAVAAWETPFTIERRLVEYHQRCLQARGGPFVQEPEAENWIRFSVRADLAERGCAVHRVVMSADERSGARDNGLQWLACQHRLAVVAEYPASNFAEAYYRSLGTSRIVFTSTDSHGRSQHFTDPEVFAAHTYYSDQSQPTQLGIGLREADDVRPIESLGSSAEYPAHYDLLVKASEREAAHELTRLHQALAVQARAPPPRARGHGSLTPG